MASGTPTVVDITAIGAIVVIAAVAVAAEMVDRLAGEGVRGEAGAGDEDLVVLIAVAGVGGLETGHILMIFQWIQNQQRVEV